MHMTFWLTQGWQFLSRVSTLLALLILLWFSTLVSKDSLTFHLPWTIRRLQSCFPTQLHFNGTPGFWATTLRKVRYNFLVQVPQTCLRSHSEHCKQRSCLKKKKKRPVKKIGLDSSAKRISRLSFEKMVLFFCTLKIMNIILAVYYFSFFPSKLRNL